MSEENFEASHLSPTDEIIVEDVKKKAVRGAVVLTGRTFFLSLVSFGATALLTVFLDPKDFGVFWIVSAIKNFLAYFSDVGLAAALIQKKETPSNEDLRTTFTVQQILVFTLLLIIFLLSPVFVRIYGLTDAGRYLLYALGISLVLSSLKTIPSVLLERKLEFEKLVLPQVVENLIYNLVAVFLAWKGFGVTSFTVAVLVSGFIGLVIIYILKPWRPKLAIVKGSLKHLFAYGVPYQANTLLATVKDDGMTMMLGGILGASGVGFLGWAQKWGQAPLRFFMDHIIKVTFPAFARLQDEKEHLRSALERSIFFITFLVFPAIVGLIVLAPVLVDIIPRYQKWEAALIPLYLITINTMFASVTTQLTNLLNSTGRIKVTFKLMIMWTVLTWAFIPFLSHRFGVNGAALGYALVGSSSIIAIFIIRRIMKFSLLRSIFAPFVSALVMGVVMFLLRGKLAYNLQSVFVMGVVGMTAYLVTIFIILGDSFKNDVQKSFKIFFSKK